MEKSEGSVICDLIEITSKQRSDLGTQTDYENDVNSNCQRGKFVFSREHPSGKAAHTLSVTMCLLTDHSIAHNYNYHENDIDTYCVLHAMYYKLFSLV